MKTEAQVLSELAKYCSFAERCIFDVRKKIKAAELPEEAEKRIIDRLVQEKFIDEIRFTRSFVNDKFRFNHWGRIKISYELKKKNISPAIYCDAMDAIDENEYIAVLTDLLKSKKRTTKGRSSQDIFQKLCRFASSRGFEAPLIISLLKNMIKDIDDAQCTT